jgi:hypothetical protein
MVFRLIELSAEARKLLHPVKPFTKAQTFEAIVKHFTALLYEERRAIVIDYLRRSAVVSARLDAEELHTAAGETGGGHRAVVPGQRNA